VDVLLKVEASGKDKADFLEADQHKTLNQLYPLRTVILRHPDRPVQCLFRVKVHPVQVTVDRDKGQVVLLVHQLQDVMLVRDVDIKVNI
jgi:hypothetical protein